MGQYGGQVVHSAVRKYLCRGALLTVTSGLVSPCLAAAQTQPTSLSESDQASKQKTTPIVVTGERQSVITSPDKQSFSIASDLQAQTGTLADALRAVPGVEVDPQGRVSLRGDPGVIILIDGRPSAMLRGESRGDAILTMPANQVERVEVMTSPSAAYSPEGSGGIINLVSKPTRRDTSTASLRTTVGVKGDGGLSLSGSRSRGPLTVSGDIAVRRLETDASIVQSRRQFGVNEAVTESRRVSDIETLSKARIGRISVDYDLNKANRLSGEVGLRIFRQESDREESLTADDELGSRRSSEATGKNQSLSLRGSWRRTLPGDGHELVTEIELERSRLQRKQNGQTELGESHIVFDRIVNNLTRRDTNIKVDYKRPIGKSAKLSTGYQAGLAAHDYDYAGRSGTDVGNLAELAGLTNAFKFNEAVHALYGTLQVNRGKFDALLGMRAEDVSLRLNQITDNMSFHRSYFRLYPTAHLNFELSGSQRLRASYSRRIQRPTGQDLNPYILYVDALNLRRGDPNLDPEIADVFELGWQSRKKSRFLSLTAFFRRSDAGFTDIVEDIGDGILLTTRANLARGRRTGLDLISSGSLSKKLSFNASGSLYWNEIDDPLFGRREGISGNARTSINWQPTAKDFLQVSANYAGPQLIAQGYRKSGPVFNLGYRRSINPKLSALITAQNVLDTAKQTLVVETPTFRDEIKQQGAGRMFLFGLAYSLGAKNPRAKDPSFEFEQNSTPATP